MHLIRLNIKDSSFERVITFLKELPESEIEILENKMLPVDDMKKKFKAISLKTKSFKFDRDEGNAR